MHFGGGVKPPKLFHYNLDFNNYRYPQPIDITH